MVGNIGRSSGKAPSSGVSELAGLLAEITALSPKHLKEIQKTTSGYHAARDAADARIAAADEAEAKLDKLAAAHHKQTKADTVALDARQVAVSAREGRAERREAEQTAADAALLERGQMVDDAERRIERVRSQLGDS